MVVPNPIDLNFKDLPQKRMAFNFNSLEHQRLSPTMLYIQPTHGKHVIDHSWI